MSNSDPSSSRWWRWLFVPIAAIGVGVLGSFTLRIIGKFSLNFAGFSSDGWMHSYILPMWVAGTFGWLVVWTSYYVAPAHKQTTAKTVNWLFIVFNALNILFAVLLSPEAAIIVTMGSIASCIGSFIALSETLRKTSRS